MGDRKYSNFVTCDKNYETDFIQGNLHQSTVSQPHLVKDVNPLDPAHIVLLVDILSYRSRCYSNICLGGLLDSFHKKVQFPDILHIPDI